MLINPWRSFKVKDVGTAGGRFIVTDFEARPPSGVSRKKDAFPVTEVVRFPGELIDETGRVDLIVEPKAVAGTSRGSEAG